MEHVPLHPSQDWRVTPHQLTVFRLWLTGWKKPRRARQLAQRQPLPHQGRAPKARKQPGPQRSQAPSSPHQAARATPETRRRRRRPPRAAANLGGAFLPAGPRRGAAGARPEPRSHWLKRPRPDKAPPYSARAPPWLSAPPPPPPPAPPPFPARYRGASTLFGLLLPRSCGLSATPATAGLASAQGGWTCGQTSV